LGERQYSACVAVCPTPVQDTGGAIAKEVVWLMVAFAIIGIVGVIPLSNRAERSGTATSSIVQK
jgi:hypothetical protein